MIYFDNQDWKCLLRGKSWRFKSSLRYSKSLKRKCNETFLEITEMKGSYCNRSFLYFIHDNKIHFTSEQLQFFKRNK